MTELLPPSLRRSCKKNSSEEEIVKEFLTEFELIVDSYEQPIERPSDYKEQKKYYSGKKVNHTRKSQLIVLPNGKDIVDVVAGEPGPKSDISMFSKSQLRKKSANDTFRLKFFDQNDVNQNDVLQF